MPYSSHMADIYSRLAKVGFDAAFIRDAVLPDWWEDDLAKNPAERAIAEAAIARHLGMQIAWLRDPSTELALPPLGKVQFKHRKGTEKGEVLPSVLVAQRAAQLVAGRLRDLPNFRGSVTANVLRTEILQKSACVDLPSLLDACWRSGIAVMPVYLVPKPSKRFEGLALYVDQKPVIVLGSKRDSPAWVIFDLAHEVAHILSGHVEPGSVLADEDISTSPDDDPNETAADEFACELLTGSRTLSFKREPLNGLALAGAARKYGERRSIMPGVVALIYGKSADRWGVAQNALKALGEDRGAHHVVIKTLCSHMELTDLPESTARFLEHVVDASLGARSARQWQKAVSF